jgi:dynein light intermediate chain
MRVRDEHKMTLAAYQTLYQSSIAFGMRKQLESEEGMDELENHFDEMNKKVKSL